MIWAITSVGRIQQRDGMPLQKDIFIFQPSIFKEMCYFSRGYYLGTPRHHLFLATPCSKNFMSTLVSTSIYICKDLHMHISTDALLNATCAVYIAWGLMTLCSVGTMMNQWSLVSIESCHDHECHRRKKTNLMKQQMKQKMKQKMKQNSSRQRLVRLFVASKRRIWTERR